MKRILILIFEQAELLDFCGPFEIISTLETDDMEPVEVLLWHPLSDEEVTSANGATVVGDVVGGLDEEPIDLLVVPGGVGSLKFIKNAAAMEMLKMACERAAHVLSVCTGARILAAMGALEGLYATTHSSAQIDLSRDYPEVIWDFSKRFHDNGKWIISAGVASGIDAALYWVGITYGERCRHAVAQAVEVPLVGNMAVYGGLAYQVVDAFCMDKAYSGNPAAVCVLDDALPDTILQAIAAQHNLSETAFLQFVEMRDGGPRYHLRWFTPESEVDLCGHATLASAHAVFELNQSWEHVVFATRSGELVVEKCSEGLRMDFPRLDTVEVSATELKNVAVPGNVVSVHSGVDLGVVVDDAETLMNWEAPMTEISELPYRCVILTAPYPKDSYDFVSRVFAPRFGIPEDPFTGSAHCWMAPYWSQRLGKETVVGLQASRRQGRAVCKVLGDRVLLSGSASLYSTGFIAAERLVDEEAVC